MKAAFCLPLAAVLLTACQPAASEPEAQLPTRPADDACGAAGLSRWIGQPDTPDARTAITAASGAKNIRWVTPGMAVTMDYRPDRLNVSIDAAGRYSAFGCS